MNKHTSDGYVLGWVLIIMLAMMILGMSALSLAARNHQSTLEEKWKNQAYYTARSVVELTAAAMVKETEDEELEAVVLQYLAEGETEFEIQVEGLSPDMGECSLIFRYYEETGKLVITAHSKYRGKKSSASVRLGGALRAESLSFHILSYGDGLWREEE